MAYGHAERNRALLRQLEAETGQLLESLDQPDLSSQPGCRRSPAEELSQVPWNVPPPAVRTKERDLPNGQRLFSSFMDEHRGRRPDRVTAVSEVQ